MECYPPFSRELPTDAVDFLTAQAVEEVGSCPEFAGGGPPALTRPDELAFALLERIQDLGPRGQSPPLAFVAAAKTDSKRTTTAWVSGPVVAHSTGPRLKLETVTPGHAGQTRLLYEPCNNKNAACAKAWKQDSDFLIRTSCYQTTTPINPRLL
jgi:hypothetical protein